MVVKPWGISSVDVELISGTLYQQHRKHRIVECLEWGAGGSTVHFTEQMHGLGWGFVWHSIEHNKVWHDRVSALAVRAGVYLVQCDGDPHREPMDDYVNFPLKMHKRFDFVFVDGRKRRRCLINASKLLAPGGVVVLHDAERSHYWPAFEHFSRHERIGDKLWRGWVDL